MMASLVANYSSDSEDDSYDEVENTVPEAKIKMEIKQEIEEQLPTKKEVKEELQIKQAIKDKLSVKLENSEHQIKQELNEHQIKQEMKEEFKEETNHSNSNFFTTTPDVSEDEDEDSSNASNRFTSTTARLPSAASLSLPTKLPSFSEVNPGVIGSSVFVNPFERAEQAKNKILEKHVRLTVAAPKKPAHQPVCWKFKKGKCHLGKNCRFFHAVDNLAVSEDSSNGHAANNNNRTNVSNSTDTQRSHYHPAAYADARRRPLEQEPEDEDSYMAGMKRKKRSGVNDRLVPPKKAFDALMELRKKERPWTIPGGWS